MRRCKSNSSLATLPAQGAQGALGAQGPAQAAAPAGPGAHPLAPGRLRRNPLSCQALSGGSATLATSFALDLLSLASHGGASTPGPDVLKDVVHRVQVEAFTHTSAYAAGVCYAEQRAAPPLLGPWDAPEQEGAARAFLACMMTPQEYDDPEPEQSSRALGGHAPARRRGEAGGEGGGARAQQARGRSSMESRSGGDDGAGP